MPDVHTIWDSSTICEGKKLGSSPNNRYSTNTKKLHNNTTEKLDKVVNYALYLSDRYEKIKGDYYLLKQQYYNISNENVKLRNELEQTIVSSKKLSKKAKQLLTNAKNGSNLERQIAFDKQRIQSLMTELERLKSQYLDLQFTTSQYEADSISSKKEIDVLNLRLKELESILSSKITEIHTLEAELSSKTMELQKCEAELSSKSFELQTLKTECGVFKQYVSDMTEQTSIQKYHTQSSISEKQNKETLGVVLPVIHFYTLLWINVIQ